MSAAAIRVLHVISGLTTGGAERLVVSAVTGLPAPEFEHAVCCLALRGRLADDAERAGAPVWCIGAFPGIRHPLAFWRLVRVIRSFKPRIVHTHLQSANLYGRLAARIARVPVIVATEHNVYTTKARRYVAAERWLARRTQALVAVSAEVRRLLAAQLRLAPESIHLIHNGVPLRAPAPDRVAAYRRRLSRDADDFVVGCVASLTPKKGHEFLLRAVALLNGRGRRCTLALAGDGPQRAALASLVAELPLTDRVIFLDDVPDVASLLAAVDAFVLPSIVEGLPLALLEAMLAGTAVVATRVGGVPEAVTDGVNGLLVDPRSPAQLADAIERLMASAPLRATLGANARATVQRGFTESRYVDTLAALYRELTARTA